MADKRQGYGWVTDELFDAKLFELINRERPSTIVASVPGVYELLAEYFSNDVLAALESERPEPWYVATVSVPGYLPQDDDPPVFDTAWEGWAYLAGERERDEDGCPDWPYPETGEYTETRETLAVLGSEAWWKAEVTPDDLDGLAPFVFTDGTGTVYGDTPGYDGDHDLGLAYCVSIDEDGR